MAYFDGGSPKNYTVGGTRFWLNPLEDESTTPARYAGFFDVGNVVEAPVESAQTQLDHWSIRYGSRNRDASLVTDMTEDIVLTMDEHTQKNFQRYWNSATLTAIPTGSGSKVDEIAFARPGELTILGKGRGATAIVVKSIDNVTTLVEGVDYDEVDVVGGFVGIVPIETANIPAAGAYVRMSYTYVVLAHKQMAPLTRRTLECQCVFFGISTVGAKFVRFINRVQVIREGTYNLTQDAWSTFQLRCKILDDSVDNPLFPNGVMEYYGVNNAEVA